MAKHACPISGIARIVGRKWTLELLYYLQERRRFCELQAAMGGVNSATLTERLKSLEQDGILRRQVISKAPLHVEYELTDKGQALVPVINALAVWARRWQSEGLK